MSQLCTLLAHSCVPRKFFYRLRAIFFLLIIAAFIVTGGCASTVNIKFPNDPAGGALSENEACIYDYDADGFWYVLFIRCDGILLADHSHSPGHHLFLQSGDFLFYTRCSGRGEVIDVMGKTMSLKNGLVLLAEVKDGNTNIVQLPAQARKFNANDPAARADALLQLIEDPTVQAFLSDAAQSKLAADDRIQKQKKHGGNAQ